MARARHIGLLAWLLLACAGDPDHDGYVNKDCDPQDASVHPKARDPWGDDIDQDCDGADGIDGDGDGYGSKASGGPDCDDEDPERSPATTEVAGDRFDANCDGSDGVDLDQDGFDAPITGGLDCADEDPVVHPGATDPWYDGVDGNCEGDDDFDRDGDGYRVDAASVPGQVTDPSYPGGDDCDDNNPLFHPGALEWFGDGFDGACNGGSDVDADGDGAEAPTAGNGDPTLDCDDDDDLVFPRQSSYFALPRADGSFDYNCDGVETASRSAVTSEVCDEAFTLPSSAWAGSLPGCGESGLWVSGCVDDGGTWDWSGSEQLQGCR